MPSPDDDTTPLSERPLSEQVSVLRHDLAGLRQVAQSSKDLFQRLLDELSRRITLVEERLDGQDVAMRQLPTRTEMQQAITHAWDDPDYVGRFNATMDDRQDRQREQRWAEMRGAVRGALKFAGGALLILQLLIALTTLYIAWHLGVHP